MDRERERVDLMSAEKPIAAGMRHIADQEQRVSERDRQGHDNTQAVSLLALYRRVQDQYVAQGNLILQLLSSQTKLAAADFKLISDCGHHHGF
jgi:hypothetical protein